MNKLQDKSSFYLNEAFFLEMEEMGNMGMYETDFEKGIFKASPQFQKIFHLPPQEHYPVTLFKGLIHSEDVSWVLQFFNECIEQHKAFDCEYRCLVNKEVFHVRSRSKIFYNNQGKVVKIVGVKQKISTPGWAKGELPQTEQQARSIVDSISDGLLTLDKHWRITYINSRGMEIVRPMHPSSADLIGQNFWKAFPGQEGTIIEQRYRQAMIEQKTVAFENYYAPLNSWFDLRAYPSNEGLSIYFLDITDRKRSQEALLQSQQLAQSRLDELEAIYTTAPVGMCILDKELRFVRINKQLAEMNGYPVEHHLGKTVREIVPNLADEAEPILRRIIETGEPVLNIELTGETAAQPGLIRTWVENWLPFINNRGEVVGINIVAQEVSELRHAIRATQESEERYYQLFNSLDDGFCVCQMLVDEEGKPYDYRFEEINHTFEAHTGLKEATGKTALELIPNLESHWIEIYGKVALSREAIRFEQGSPVMRRWFDVYAFPFGSQQSRRFAIQFKDISERKQREIDLQLYREELANANNELAATIEELQVSNEELSRANELLTQVNNDLDNFVYTASHDLKAPIANIHGLLRLLTKNLSPESSSSSTNQKILSLMDESVARFMKTIAKLSDIVQLQKQSGQATELVSLPEVIEAVKKDLNMVIDQSEAQVQVALNGCSSLEFAPKNLQSIIYNLLSNAIKYRHLQRKPVIHVTCQTLENYYLLTVTDNGLGINPHQKHRLFSLFQRLHDHVEGTGIGLYMVKKIIENAGGKIEVESELGVGSSFKVYFKR